VAVTRWPPSTSLTPYPPRELAGRGFAWSHMSAGRQRSAGSGTRLQGRRNVGSRWDITCPAPLVWPTRGWDHIVALERSIQGKLLGHSEKIVSVTRIDHGRDAGKGVLSPISNDEPTVPSFYVPARDRARLATPDGASLGYPCLCLSLKQSPLPAPDRFLSTTSGSLTEEAPEVWRARPAMSPLLVGGQVQPLSKVSKP
jgi:hypothetical protein